MNDEDREALAKALDTLRNATQAQVIDALQPAVDAIARRRAAEELRHLAEVLHFVPLSEREAGPVSDYTAGMNAAGDIALLCTDALTRHEEAL